MDHSVKKDPLADRLSDLQRSAVAVAESKKASELRRDCTNIIPLVVLEIEETYSRQAPKMIEPQPPEPPVMLENTVIFQMILEGSSDLLQCLVGQLELPPSIRWASSIVSFHYQKPTDDKAQTALIENYEKDLALVRAKLETIRGMVEKHNSELGGKIRPILEKINKARREDDAMANSIVQELNKRRGDKHTTY